MVKRTSVVVPSGLTFVVKVWVEIRWGSGTEEGEEIEVNTTNTGGIPTPTPVLVLGLEEASVLAVTVT